MVPATVPSTTVEGTAWTPPFEEPDGAAWGADESRLRHPPTASARAARTAAAVVLDGTEPAWMGAKPESFPVWSGGAVAGFRRASGTRRQRPVVVTGYTMHQRATV